VNRCEKCDELHFGSKHTCAPRWRVWVHDYHEVGDDADSWEVHARDAESAAEVALATHNDEGQYVERETLVFVRRLDTGEQRWIRVYGEPSIHWNTGEVDPPEGLEAKAPTSDGSDDEDEGDEEAEAC